MFHQLDWTRIYLTNNANTKAKLNAGVRLNHHMISYGDRTNDYEAVSNCVYHLFCIDRYLTPR